MSGGRAFGEAGSDHDRCLPAEVGGSGQGLVALPVSRPSKRIRQTPASPPRERRWACSVQPTRQDLPRYAVALLWVFGLLFGAVIAMVRRHCETAKPTDPILRERMKSAVTMSLT